MIRRGESGDSGEDEDPEWLDWYLEDTQLSLASMEAEREKLSRELAEKVELVMELQISA